MELVEQEGFVPAERVGEQLCRARLVRNGIRAREYRIRSAVFREYDAVPVDDFSPFGDDGDLPRPLVERPDAEFAAPCHLYVEKARRQKTKKKGYRRKHGR